MKTIKIHTQTNKFKMKSSLKNKTHSSFNFRKKCSKIYHSWNSITADITISLSIIVSSHNFFCENFFGTTHILTFLEGTLSETLKRKFSQSTALPNSLDRNRNIIFFCLSSRIFMPNINILLLQESSMELLHTLVMITKIKQVVTIFWHFYY